MPKIFIIGVTGGFGTGKTTVANIFKKLGAKVIDADRIAHRLLFKKSAVYNKTVAEFGCRILNKDETIDRKRLSRIVFNDARKLRAYLKIIHPEIKRIIKREIKQASDGTKARVIVLDAPLLIEAGLAKAVNKLLVVKAKRDIQICRLKNKFALNKSDILKRIKFQLPLSKKIKMANFIIDNSRTVKDTEKQVRKIWREVKNGHY